ncbi:LysA protein [Mycolicibacterium frederiksbergense]|uniref:LysA protein n=1 Tax=Mycolicibacterium frederiksbergense TaxID=117567 RepID=UPI002476D61C|nr:LysA protein [Mycolicibacterium frederiksbergense]
MTLSDFLMHVLSGQTPRARAAVSGTDALRSSTGEDEYQELVRYQDYRKMFRAAEVTLPAAILRKRAVAKWARDQQVSVDVHSAADIATVAAASIPLSRVTVFADSLRESELRAAAKLGYGHIVVGTVAQVEVLRSVVVQHEQDVVIRMSDAGVTLRSVTGAEQSGFRFDSNESDAAMAAVIGHDRLNLVGLHCEVGADDDDFISYPAAIGQMIAEMTQIRRNHGVLLSRLGLGGGRPIPAVTWLAELRRLATEIDESLDDACGTLRFPRPLVVLSASVAIGGRNAA